ncbi:MAG: 2-oxo acid dehydrogenase subunit E2 [Shewanellaceae bacterium]|nr:2-oxo acid dehydrogenase subunit E2 [Shewanellaceae bacterium]
MQQTFILPDIGEGVVECEIIQWQVGVGDTVEEDQVVVEVMTDKAVVEIPSPYAGTVHRLYYEQGEIAKVHAPLFEIETMVIGEEATVALDTIDDASLEMSLELPNSPDAASLTDEIMSQHVIDMPLSDEVSLQTAVGSDLPKALASPAVRRLAKSNNIDIQQVQGSGKNGRVLREDIERYPISSPISIGHGAHRSEPLTTVQRAMAKSMLHAVQTIPHFTYGEEVDVTRLCGLRQQIEAVQETKISLMAFFIKSLSLALLEYPILNARLNAEATELTYLSHHHIGFAVNSSIGLLVPNIKHCEHKSIFEINDELQRLIALARAGRVKQEDLQDGTITVSNIGAIGGNIATPIIHQNQLAIVALGRIQTLPRFDADHQIQARSILQINWSADHRILDGGTLATFCRAWQDMLENPETMLLKTR